MDMGDGTDPAKRYYEIEKMSPKVLITFDLAGHILRTGTDTLSLNNIYARFAHILFHNPEYYGNELKARQNLSMFTYIPSDIDLTLYNSRFPGVPNIDAFMPIIRKPETEKEHADNRKNIKCWWDGFQKEAML